MMGIFVWTGLGKQYHANPECTTLLAEACGKKVISGVLKSALGTSYVSNQRKPCECCKNIPVTDVNSGVEVDIPTETGNTELETNATHVEIKPSRVSKTAKSVGKSKTAKK